MPMQGSVNRAGALQAHGRQRPIRPYIMSFAGVESSSKVGGPSGRGLIALPEGFAREQGGGRTDSDQALDGALKRCNLEYPQRDP